MKGKHIEKLVSSLSRKESEFEKLSAVSLLEERRDACGGAMSP